MKVTMKTVGMGRSLRTDYALKTRQPLKALHVVTRDAEERRILQEMEDLIKDELNVKSVIFRENEDELVEYQAKANFRALGKQLGKDMKAAAEKIEALELRQIHALLAGREITLELDGRSFPLTPEAVEIQRIEKENLKVINDGSLTVALDPELTPELIEEGLVRDLVRGIQNLQKGQRPGRHGPHFTHALGVERAAQRGGESPRPPALRNARGFLEMGHGDGRCGDRLR